MKELKSKKLRCLRHLRNEPNENTLRIYRNIRKLYKSKIKEKIEEVRNKNRQKVENYNSPSEFWKFIKSKSNNNKCVNHISTNDWKLYFEKLRSNAFKIDS